MAEQGIPIIGPILNRIIGSRNDRFVKKYTQRVQAINALEKGLREVTDAQLRSKLGEFRERLDKGTKADDLMVEAFAVAREAMDRAVGIRGVFNPRFNFDPSLLKPEGRAMYDRLRAEMDAMPVLIPRTFVPRQDAVMPPPDAVRDETGEWLGCQEMIPGWMRLDIPAEFYQAIREIYPESRPPFRARPFDVQLIGGMVLTQGKIAEMRTGEGKTIVAPLATYLACIERLRVHVVTVNDYLVQRDRDWTFPFFRALGLTIGAIHPQHMQNEDVKRLMYRCDVVYGTTSEFGFDYLRDNMKDNEEQQVQKKRHFAIVDEVDSTLIDEARTPLIISGQAHDQEPRYDLADQLARHLVGKQKPWTDAEERVEKCRMRIKGLEGDIRQARDKNKVPEMQNQLAESKAQLPKLEAERDRNTQYFEVKLERKQAHLTHEGVSEAQRVAQVGSFYVDENIDLPHLLEQSLRAHTVYELDKDYVVMNVPDQSSGRNEPGIVIVDSNTGRPMIGRQWSDGLHQAIECKEKVRIKQETQTVATITIQNFFKMYKRLAGMTGTADTEAQEFHDIYGLDVVAIPTNKPVVRRDFDDMVFLTAKDKWTFITDEIKAFHDAGRPVLVGTTSVEKSESLSKLLMRNHSIRHEVLNAKQHDREANIVESAGQLGAVMIATNMAGRGTDIKLGKFTREQLLDHWLKRNIAPGTLTVQATDQELREQIYVKIAPNELGVNRRELEGLPFAELELRLLRHWANKHTWESPKAIEKMKPDELREALDASGRFLLHRVRWFKDIEDMGGLHVVGTERHEARRIDNQLRGRAGRQGDKGSSRFFVGLEDDLMRMFSGETTMKVLASLGMKEGDAIEHPMLSKSVERAQKKVEERNFHYRKTVLEYDEIMEHQRQSFYGMRQRVIEGRDVKGLILSFITSTVDDAVAEYLEPDYPAKCCAEYAGARLECSISADRLRGREQNEMEKVIADEAKYEMRQTIDVTLGEYIPAEGVDKAVDFDAAGLARWAKNRFGVELTEKDLGAGTAEERRRIQTVLAQAATEAIERCDLSGLAQFLVPNYGAAQLAKWVDDKLSLEVAAEEIVKASKEDAEDDVNPVTKLLMRKVSEAYEKREVEYPVDFAMQATKQMSQVSRQDAAAQLISWANTRYNLGWNNEIFKKTPGQVREELLIAARSFFKENKIEQEIKVALKTTTDDELDAHFRTRFGRPLPETMRHVQPYEREDKIRARVESILRSELLQFERTVVLKTADDSWRNHLYAMDQLRDSINYRAFSQSDPRIEYKREGSRMFNDMLQEIRGQVTEYVFKAKLTPAPPPQMARAMPPRAPAAGPMISGGITGPGLGGLPMA
ncbi:MAG: preprotein translocase subunit SecA [Phycisphaerales bacterium]